MKRFSPIGTNTAALLLAASLGLTSPVSLAQSLPALDSDNSVEALKGDVQIMAQSSAIHDSLPLAGASRTVTMSFRGVSVADALRALAKKGGFNAMVDDSVTGNVTLD